MAKKPCLNCQKLNEDRDFCDQECYIEYKNGETKEHEQRFS